MENENQRVRLTKRLLKESLIEMLKEMGIEKISISELCKRSGINRTTFYLHYATPKDLLRDIERDFSAQSMASMRETERNETLEQQLTRICTFIYEHSELQKIILQNSSDDEIAEILADSGFPLLDTSAYFPQHEKMDQITRYLTSVFVNYGIFHVVRRWIIDEIPKSPAEISKIICDIVLWESKFVRS